MASTTIKVYGKFQTSLLAKEVLIAAGGTNIYAMLVKPSYTFDQDLHRYLSDITGEVSGTNYTAGGVQVTGLALPYVTATHSQQVTANTIVFPSVTIAAGTDAAAGIVLYDRLPGTNATRPLIGFGLFDNPQSPSAGNLTVNLAGGILLGGSTPS